EKAYKIVLLHVLLIRMDERDRPLLGAWQAETLNAAHPQTWLPFISDAHLCNWRDLIYQQIKPDGQSQTLDIFGARIQKTPSDLRAILDSPATLARDLWSHVPQSEFERIESAMYEDALEQLCLYWR